MNEDELKKKTDELLDELTALENSTADTLRRAEEILAEEEIPEHDPDDESIPEIDALLDTALTGLLPKEE